MKQDKQNVKSFFEFLGRASITIMVLTLMKEVFAEELFYNWIYFLGGISVLIWSYLPFLKEENKNV